MGASVGNTVGLELGASVVGAGVGSEVLGDRVVPTHLASSGSTEGMQLQSAGDMPAGSHVPPPSAAWVSVSSGQPGSRSDEMLPPVDASRLNSTQIAVVVPDAVSSSS